MVNIICSYFKMNGAVTSLLDTYFNIKNYINDIEFNIVCNPRSTKNFIKYKNEYPNINFKNITTHNFDTLILSADFIGQEYNIFKKFKYNKLIILDSFKIYIDYCKNNNATANRIKELSNCYILGNKFNESFFKENDNYYIYYHKFSKERLDFLEKIYSKEYNILIRNEEETDFFMHKFSSYKYERFHTCDNITFLENIGKLIFEYRYLNKPVYYSSKKKTIDDGLTEYLSLFGIDDNNSQDILITKNDIRNKLFMKDNDLMLEIINT